MIPATVVSYRPLAEMATAQPARKVFFSGERELTYGEVHRHVGQLCGLFRARGLKPGDTVLLAVAEDAAMTELFLALVAGGLVPLIVGAEATRREAEALLAIASPKAFVVDAPLLERWGVDAGDRFVLKVGKPAKANLLGKLFKRPAAPVEADAYPAVLDTLPDAAWPEAPGPADLAYVLFTSGTTSKPKGVEISHGALMAHLETLSRQFGYDAESRLLNALPLHHVDGLVQGPVVAFYSGASLARPVAFSAQTVQAFLDTVYSRRITHLIAVPTMLALIERLGAGMEEAFRTEDFKFVISAAARLETHLWEAFETRFGVEVVNVYGLTETVTGGLFSGPGPATRRVGTLGKPVDCAVRVVGADHADVARGEPGELWMAGPHVMTGYHRDPEATESVLRAGWLATGDLVREDEDGFFHIVGRLKNTVISGGRNISPEEVAEVLNTHPDVRESVALGVDEAAWGEALVACVVPSSPGALSAEALQRYASEHLMAYKVPRRFVFLDELPKGPSGKVRLDAVRALLAQHAEVDVSASGGSVMARVVALAAATFRVEASGLNEASGPHNTLGWSSLAHMEFVVALEKAFGVTLGTRDVMALQSLGSAAAIVERLSKEKA